MTLQSAQDITQRKINEKELEDQTNRMENSSRLITLGEMASTITHEINQPLTAITAYANTAIEVIGNAPEVNRGQVLEIYKKIANRPDASTRLLKTSAHSPNADRRRSKMCRSPMSSMTLRSSAS